MKKLLALEPQKEVLLKVELGARDTQVSDRPFFVFQSYIKWVHVLIIYFHDLSLQRHEYI